MEAPAMTLCSRCSRLPSEPNSSLCFICNPPSLPVEGEKNKKIPIKLGFPLNSIVAKTANIAGEYAHGTQSADFWSLQYQYASHVAVSPALSHNERQAWQAYMQHTYGRYAAAVRASLHPLVCLTVMAVANEKQGGQGGSDSRRDEPQNDQPQQDEAPHEPDAQHELITAEAAVATWKKAEKVEQQASQKQLQQHPTADIATEEKREAPATASPSGRRTAAGSRGTSPPPGPKQRGSPLLQNPAVKRAKVDTKTENKKDNQKVKKSRKKGKVSRSSTGPSGIPQLWCHAPSCSGDRWDWAELLVCRTCQQGFHAQCTDPPSSFDVVAQTDFSCMEDKGCIVCQSNESEADMVICDACDRCFHIWCHIPELLAVPSNDHWFCSDCRTCVDCHTSLADAHCKRLDNYSQNRRTDHGVPKRLCENCVKKEKRRLPASKRLSCCVCDKVIEDGSLPFSRMCESCGGSFHIRCRYPGTEEVLCRKCSIYDEKLIRERYEALN